MKRSREVREKEYDSEEPLSGTEPNLEQSAAAESDGKGTAQPPPEADTDTKRSKLQKKLKKLKQTYENRGRHLNECVSAFLKEGTTASFSPSGPAQVSFISAGYRPTWCASRPNPCSDLRPGLCNAARLAFGPHITSP